LLALLALRENYGIHKTQDSRHDDIKKSGIDLVSVGGFIREKELEEKTTIVKFTGWTKNYSTNDKVD
jgi:hypothetical protein